MQTFTVGRADDNDVVISHETVSRLHAEVVLTLQGRIYVTDCASTHGSFVNEETQWKPIKQQYVDPDSHLLLGRYQISVSQLLAKYKNKGGASAGIEDSDDDRPVGDVIRDPETGEPINI